MYIRNCVQTGTSYSSQSTNMRKYLVYCRKSLSSILCSPKGFMACRYVVRNTLLCASFSELCRYAAVAHGEKWKQSGGSIQDCNLYWVFTEGRKIKKEEQYTENKLQLLHQPRLAPCLSLSWTNSICLGSVYSPPLELFWAATWLRTQHRLTPRTQRENMFLTSSLISISLNPHFLPGLISSQET